MKYSFSCYVLLTLKNSVKRKFFAIKELDAKYQEPEKRINDLEKQIEALENKLK